MSKYRDPKRFLEDPPGYTSFSDFGSVAGSEISSNKKVENVVWENAQFPVIHLTEDHDAVSDITSIANETNVDISRIMKSRSTDLLATLQYVPDDVFSGTRDPVRHIRKNTDMNGLNRQEQNPMGVSLRAQDHYPRPKAQSRDGLMSLPKDSHASCTSSNYVYDEDEEYERFVKEEKLQIERQDAYAKTQEIANRSICRESSPSIFNRGDVPQNTTQIRSPTSQLRSYPNATYCPKKVKKANGSSPHRVQEKEISFESIKTRQTQSTADESDDESDVFDLTSTDGDSCFQHSHCSQDSPHQYRSSPNYRSFAKKSVAAPNFHNRPSKEGIGGRLIRDKANVTRDRTCLEIAHRGDTYHLSNNIGKFSNKANNQGSPRSALENHFSSFDSSGFPQFCGEKKTIPEYNASVGSLSVNSYTRIRQRPDEMRSLRIKEKQTIADYRRGAGSCTADSHKWSKERTATNPPIFNNKETIRTCSGSFGSHSEHSSRKPRQKPTERSSLIINTKETISNCGGGTASQSGNSCRRFRERSLERSSQGKKPEMARRAISQSPTARRRAISQSPTRTINGSAWIHPALRSSTNFGPPHNDKIANRRSPSSSISAENAIEVRRTQSHGPVNCDLFTIKNEHNKVPRSNSLHDWEGCVSEIKTPSFSYKAPQRLESNGLKQNVIIKKNTLDLPRFSNKDRSPVDVPRRLFHDIYKPEGTRPSDSGVILKKSHNLGLNQRVQTSASSSKPLKAGCNQAQKTNNENEFEYNWKQDAIVAQVVSKFADGVTPVSPQLPGTSPNSKLENTNTAELKTPQLVISPQQDVLATPSKPVPPLSSSISQLHFHLDTFMSKVRKEGLQMQKKNRFGIWQTRILTFSTEVLWIHGKLGKHVDDGDPACFPKALIWTKKKVPQRLLSVRDMDTREIGGVLLSKLKVCTTEDNEMKVLLSFKKKNDIDVMITCYNDNDVSMLRYMFMQIINMHGNK